MRAARCEEYGGPANVVIRDIPQPAAAPDHVVVDVAAAAVNYPDLLFIANRYQVSAPLPFTPGSEFAGRVASVGEGVTGLSVGDLVYGSVLNGAMAEQVLVPARSVALIPAGLSLVEAAAFRVTYLTAYHSLVTAGGLRPGQWVVVLGAAGGVGTATVDVAVRLGARVVAVAASAERLAVAEQLGAEAGIDYVKEDLKQRIRDITGDGADLVVDPVGDRWAEPALRAIRWGGRFVTVGYAGGDIPRIPLNVVLLKNITVRGVELRTWTERLADETAHARDALTGLVAGGLRPVVSEVHELDDIAAALQRVADRAATGKVVIRVASQDQQALPAAQDGLGGHPFEQEYRRRRMAEPVLVERHGFTLVITINRPEVKNALDGAAARALAAAADELDADDALRVGVLTGTNGSFCTGMDLKAYLRGDRPRIEGRGFGGITMTPPRKPLIAAVEGWALAGGFELMLACDLVVAGEGSKFGVPEVKRSLVAAGGAALLLPRRIPFAVAMELLLTGERISAARAAELGLVNRLVPDGTALDGALQLAEVIAANGPLAVAVTKQIARAQADWTVTEGWQRQEELYKPVFDSADAREGATAFAEKRAPVWRGV